MAGSVVPRYQIGEVVPSHFSAPIVVASCIVSLLGAITTVELLHRKKGNRGWINWFHQLAVSVSFGLVAIWCMHFVGNRAIIMGDGESELQLDYNSGFTALSAFLPIIFLFIALTIFEWKGKGTTFWPLLFVSGFIAGLAITGMHYVGNFGISNYHLDSPAPYIIGAAAIAIGASIAAFALFFYFREKWVNSFPKRMASAIVLTSAVSGMHWLASVGTSYRLKRAITLTSDKRNVNLIVAMVCAILACAVCLTFAFLTQRRRRKLADRAQHVVLASATFDSDGRLLVTQEGLPPCRKVTKQFNQKSFDDEFNVAHPVFQWLYRVTFNWNAVLDLVPGMRNHLRSIGFMRDRTSRPSTNATLSTYEESEGEKDYSIIFREYFCVAADELAGMLDTRLESMGVLYNGILSTGSISSEFKKKRARTRSDVELGLKYPTMFGKGQLLFLVRMVDKHESAKLVTQGYRFAYPRTVSEIIARTMKVPHDEIEDFLERIQLYSQPSQPLSAGGTYLACFAIRAAVRSTQRSWDILVPTHRPGDLPTVELSKSPLTTLQLNRLSKLDSLSVSQCIIYLNNIAAEITNMDEKSFIEHLLDMITELTRQVPEDFFKQAVFSTKAVAAPGLGDDRDSTPPQLYAFSVIPDVHVASTKSTSVTYVPLSMFQCIQRVYKHSPDHAILAQRIHREFGTILSNKDIAQYSSRRTSRTKSQRHSTRLSRLSIPSVQLSKSSTPMDATSPIPDSPIGRAHSMDVKSDKSSARRKSDQSTRSPRRPSMAFGGIMVSSDTKVEVYEKEEGEIELNDWGVSAEATVASEAPTYVDELFRITSTRWQNR